MSECRPGAPSTEMVPLTFFNTPGPSIQAVCATRTSMGPPPKPGSLGWNWPLGKTAHFAGTEALPDMIPHGGTKLGTLAQRWGMGARVVEPITHTRTGSKTKGKRKAANNKLRHVRRGRGGPLQAADLSHIGPRECAFLHAGAT